MVRCMDGMVWCGVVFYGVVFHGMVWYGMVWYGMVWYGMILLAAQVIHYILLISLQSVSF